jgi:hypothetical protein
VFLINFYTFVCWTQQEKAAESQGDDSLDNIYDEAVTAVESDFELLFTDDDVMGHALRSDDDVHVGCDRAENVNADISIQNGTRATTTGQSERLNKVSTICL